jgi:hypothetical protein
MRMAVVPLIALGLGGCMLDPATDPARACAGQRA